MGNGNQIEGKYLLCPICFNKVPQFRLFIVDKTAKIRIMCLCQGSQGIPKIMDLNEYLIKIKYRDTLLNVCNQHTDKPSNYFCINCEKWLCDKCKREHNDSRCTEFCKSNDAYDLECLNHDQEVSAFCTKCQKTLCKKCIENHSHINNNSSNNHQIVYFEEYLSNKKEEKIKKDLEKYKLEYNKNVVMKDLFLKKYETSNDEKVKSSLALLNQSYATNKEINDLISEFIYLMFSNLENQRKKSGKIKNKKVIINILLNIDKDEVKQKDLTINSLINYFNTSFINQKLKYNFKYLNQLSSESEDLEINNICLLEGNYFAIARENIIQLWNWATYQKSGTLIGHNSIVIHLCKMPENKLASCSNDKTIKIWNILTKECINTINLQGNPSFIFLIKSNINTNIGIINNKKILEIWDTEKKTNILQKIYEGYKWFNSSYQLSSGHLIIGTMRENNKDKEALALVIDENNFEVLKEIEATNSNSINVFYEMKNGDIIMGLKRDYIYILDKEFKLKNIIEDNYFSTTAIAELGNDLIICTTDKYSINVWNVETLQCVHCFDISKKEIYYMLCTPDKQIITCGDDNNIDIIKIEEA